MKIVFDDGIFALLNHFLTVYAVPLRPVLNSYDFSKIESGKMEIVPSEYSFSELLHDVLSMIAMKAQAKGLEIRLELDEHLPGRLFGDDVRIRQILVKKHVFRSPKVPGAAGLL